MGLPGTNCPLLMSVSITASLKTLSWTFSPRTKPSIRSSNSFPSSGAPSVDWRLTILPLYFHWRYKSTIEGSSSGRDMQCFRTASYSLLEAEARKPEPLQSSSSCTLSSFSSAPTTSVVMVSPKLSARQPFHGSAQVGNGTFSGIVRTAVDPWPCLLLRMYGYWPTAGRLVNTVKLNRMQ
jgi:hypothetical protein